MDGNGRWARRRGLPVLAGHRAGARALRRTVEAAIDLGVRSLSVYAFSTENWTRPPDEVSDLLDLLGRDDPARVQGPGRTGRARALRRTPRPPLACARRRDAGARGHDRRERSARPVRLLRLRRTGRAGRGRAAARARRRGGRGDRRGGTARAPVRAAAARPRPRHPHLGGEPASRTSCSSRSRTPSSSSRTSSGPTSGATSSPARCTSTRAADGASGADERPSSRACWWRSS